MRLSALIDVVGLLLNFSPCLTPETYSSFMMLSIYVIFLQEGFETQVQNIY